MARILRLVLAEARSINPGRIDPETDELLSHGQSTTLDDVFMHYTGRQLRDALKDAAGYDPSFMYQR